MSLWQFNRWEHAHLFTTVCLIAFWMKLYRHCLVKIVYFIFVVPGISALLWACGSSIVESTRGTGNVQTAKPTTLTNRDIFGILQFTKFSLFEISFINKNKAHGCIHSNTVGIFLEFCRRLDTILELDRSFQKKTPFLPNTAKRTHNIRGTNCSTVLIWLLYSHVREAVIYVLAEFVR